ncbi:MAG: outer membrane beta-barrel protein [Gammaproteobacteria bacterium]|jgi:hypothetical protein
MIINRLLTPLVCAGLVLFPAICAAKGFNYSYGEAGYTNLSDDKLDGHANGATVRLSFGATDHIHVKGEYSHFGSVDERSSGKKDKSVDIDRFIIGLGGNLTVLKDVSFLKRLDVLTTISYYDAEYSKDSNRSDRGYQIEPGIRAQVMKKLELDASVTRLDIDNYNDTGFGGGAVYNFYKHFSATGTYRHFSDDDIDEFFLGIRLDF